MGNKNMDIFYIIISSILTAIILIIRDRFIMWTNSKTKLANKILRHIDNWEIEDEYSIKYNGMILFDQNKPYGGRPKVYIILCDSYWIKFNRFDSKRISYKIADLYIKKFKKAPYYKEYIMTD